MCKLKCPPVFDACVTSEDSDSDGHERAFSFHSDGDRGGDGSSMFGAVTEVAWGS
jgi:hypothetical protein